MGICYTSDVKSVSIVLSGVNENTESGVFELKKERKSSFLEVNIIVSTMSWFIIFGSIKATSFCLSNGGCFNYVAYLVWEV